MFFWVELNELNELNEQKDFKLEGGEKMRKLFFVASFLIVFVVAPMVMADTVMVNRVKTPISSDEECKSGLLRFEKTDRFNPDRG